MAGAEEHAIDKRLASIMKISPTRRPLLNSRCIAGERILKRFYVQCQMMGPMNGFGAFSLSRPLSSSKILCYFDESSVEPLLFMLFYIDINV